MDKRLLKSLATHKANYEERIAKRIAENQVDQTKLDAINAMLAEVESIGAGKAAI